MLLIAGLRYLLAQGWNTLSRFHAISAKTRICARPRRSADATCRIESLRVHRGREIAKARSHSLAFCPPRISADGRGVDFKQVDRETHWDNFIILQAIVMTIVHKLPYLEFHSFPLMNRVRLCSSVHARSFSCPSSTRRAVSGAPWVGRRSPEVCRLFCQSSGAGVPLGAGRADIDSLYRHREHGTLCTADRSSWTRSIVPDAMPACHASQLRAGCCSFSCSTWGRLSSSTTGCTGPCTGIRCTSGTILTITPASSRSQSQVRAFTSVRISAAEAAVFSRNRHETLKAEQIVFHRLGNTWQRSCCPLCSVISRIPAEPMRRAFCFRYSLSPPCPHRFWNSAQPARQRLA